MLTWQLCSELQHLELHLHGRFIHVLRDEHRGEELERVEIRSTNAAVRLEHEVLKLTIGRFRLLVQTCGLLLACLLQQGLDGSILLWGWLLHHSLILRCSLDFGPTLLRLGLHVTSLLAAQLVLTKLDERNQAKRTQTCGDGEHHLPVELILG